MHSDRDSLRPSFGHSATACIRSPATFCPTNTAARSWFTLRACFANLVGHCGAMGLRGLSVVSLLMLHLRVDFTAISTINTDHESNHGPERAVSGVVGSRELAPRTQQFRCSSDGPELSSVHSPANVTIRSCCSPDPVGTLRSSSGRSYCRRPVVGAAVCKADLIAAMHRFATLGMEGDVGTIPYYRALAINGPLHAEDGLRKAVGDDPIGLLDQAQPKARPAADRKTPWPFRPLVPTET
jgi:hypothetical protein